MLMLAKCGNEDGRDEGIRGFMFEKVTKMANRWIEWQTRAGEAVTAGGVTVIPQAQALTVRLPFGGFVWNRPVAVLVQRGRQTERIPIIDMTRVVQVGLVGLGLVFSIILWLRSRKMIGDA